MDVDGTDTLRSYYEQIYNVNEGVGGKHTMV